MRILIRRSGGVRGVLFAFIAAFDSHFNLFLKDVDEIYVPLKSRRKIDELNISDFLKGVNESNPEEQLREKKSMSNSIKSKDLPGEPLNSNERTQHRNARRRAYFKRNHFQQLLLRGSNVILVNQVSGFGKT